MNGPHDHGQFFDVGSSSTSNNPTMSFINDVFPYESGVYTEAQFMHDPVPERVPIPVDTARLDKFKRLLALQQTPVSSSSETTILQNVMEIMRIKVECKSTVRLVDEI